MKRDQQFFHEAAGLYTKMEKLLKLKDKTVDDQSFLGFSQLCVV